MYGGRKIKGIAPNNSFNPIKSVHQSTSSNCGLYVFINSLLITYIGLHAPEQVELLQNLEVYRYLERQLTELYYDYYHSRPSQTAKDEFAIYFADSSGNIPDFTRPRSEFVAGLREMYTVPILDKYEKKIEIGFAGITLDLAELAQHIIVVENSFAKDCLCNNIFINSGNLAKMRKFYSAPQSIISFIIGNAGHWKLYVVNKIGDVAAMEQNAAAESRGMQYQTIYLDSMGSGPSAEFVQGLNSRLLQFTKFDDFFAGVLECIRKESDINVNATDNLDFFITYDFRDMPPISRNYLAEVFRNWITLESTRSAQDSYMQSYRRLISRIRDNLAAPLLRDTIPQLPEWSAALRQIDAVQIRPAKSGGNSNRVVHKKLSKWVRFILV